MISYVMVGTNDLPKALSFYDKLLPLLNANRVMESPRVVMYGNNKGPMFGVCKPFNEESATSGNGTMIAFNAMNTEQVKKVHALALELGASNEGAPGARGQFYCAYFRDLDGNKFNLFCSL